MGKKVAHNLIEIRRQIENRITNLLTFMYSKEAKGQTDREVIFPLYLYVL